MNVSVFCDGVCPPVADPRVYWAPGILAFIKPTPRDLSPLELQTEQLKIEQLAPSTSVLHKSKTLIQIASTQTYAYTQSLNKNHMFLTDIRAVNILGTIT